MGGEAVEADDFRADGTSSPKMRTDFAPPRIAARACPRPETGQHDHARWVLGEGRQVVDDAPAGRHAAAAMMTIGPATC